MDLTRNGCRDRDIDSSGSSIDFPNLANPYGYIDSKRFFWFYNMELITRISSLFDSNRSKKIAIVGDNPLFPRIDPLKHGNDLKKAFGKKCITVYIDMLDYRGVGIENFIYAIRRETIKSLTGGESKNGKLEEILPETADEVGTNLFLKVLDHTKKLHLSFIFVVDRFDIFLKDVDHEVLSFIIELFHYLEKFKDNIYFIFSSSQDILYLEKDNPAYTFFKSSTRLFFKDFLEEEGIKRSILEPIKEKVFCSGGAVAEILQLSGKSLYWQQVICYHIITFLKKNYRNTCSKEDVEEVADRLIDDKQLTDIFPWEETLSLSDRLLFAALADEEVTRPLAAGGYLLADMHNILGSILGPGIYRRIKNLQNTGYLTEMEERNFPAYPFRIPLYGRWIRRKHPFLKTIFENSGLLAEKINILQLGSAIENTQGNKLTPFNKAIIIEIIKKWLALKHQVENREAAGPRAQVEEFLQSFARLTNLKIDKDRFSVDNDYYIINIKKLDIGILEEALFIVQDKIEFEQDDIHYVENIATLQAVEAQTRIMIFFYLKKIEKVEALVKKPYLSLITVAENELKRIILSYRASQVFRKVILSKLSLSKVSPYHTAGPAKTIFYGRSDVISRITSAHNISFSIVGARKIGKTSLIYKLLDYCPANKHYIFLDLQADYPDSQNYEPLLEKLEKKLAQAVNRGVKFAGNISRLAEVIQELWKSGTRITLIIDEIDGFLQVDSRYNFRLMRLFRDLSQKGFCQFIFVGFDELFQRKREIKNPLYNFVEEIQLSPLEEDSAFDLLTKPMESIGIHYQDKKDIKSIMKFTSCHPNLLQFFCQRLIKKIEKHEQVEDKRIIFAEDIEEIFDSEYEEYIIEEIYLFPDGLPPTARLIIILLAGEYPKRDVFSLEDTKEILHRDGIRLPINLIRKNLKNLVMRFILKDMEKDHFSFALNNFPLILRKRIDHDFKIKLIREVKADAVQSI